MLWYIGGFAVMLAGMVALATALPEPTAFYVWAGAAAAACLLGALAIASQPVGQPTMAGRLGSIAMRWGFRAGQGRLAPAILISWLVWLVLGFGVITAVQHRQDGRTALFALAWCVDLLVLFRLLGLMLANRGAGRSMIRSLAGVTAVITAMLVISGIFWLRGEPATQRLALLVAGGPPAFVAAGYGLFLAVVLVSGKKARWN